jgi:nicotinamidase-related amidase
MRLIAEQTAVVVVDIQERLLPHIDNHRQVLARSLRLLRGLRLLDIPLLVTEQYPKGLGPTVEELKKVLPDEEILEKISFSCCGAPDFMARLSALKRPNIVLAGIETHVCVLQTALDLLAAGYTPVVVADCVSSRQAEDRSIALDRMRSEGCIVTSSESLLFELCRRADSPPFKQISRLVK